MIDRNATCRSDRRRKTQNRIEKDTNESTKGIDKIQKRRRAWSCLVKDTIGSWAVEPLYTILSVTKPYDNTAPQIIHAATNIHANRPKRQTYIATETYSAKNDLFLHTCKSLSARYYSPNLIQPLVSPAACINQSRGSGSGATVAQFQPQAPPNVAL